MAIKRITTSEKETKNLAQSLAALLEASDVITLNGQLGAGKTTFTKGLAEALGIQEIISSPTFTIIKEYENKIPLYHIDAYRLEFSEEDIGFDEYFYGSGITVIEWAEFIEDFLPEARIDIEIRQIDENKREFILYALGEKFASKLEKLK